MRATHAMTVLAVGIGRVAASDARTLGQTIVKHTAKKVPRSITTALVALPARRRMASPVH
jgi:hypothetical protein